MPSFSQVSVSSPVSLVRRRQRVGLLFVWLPLLLLGVSLVQAWLWLPGEEEAFAALGTIDPASPPPLTFPRAAMALIFSQLPLLAAGIALYKKPASALLGLLCLVGLLFFALMRYALVSDFYDAGSFAIPPLLSVQLGVAGLVLLPASLLSLLLLTLERGIVTRICAVITPLVLGYLFVVPM